MTPPPRHLFTQTIAAVRRETVAGALLLLAALAALVWANSPWRQAYADLRDAQLGPDVLGLDLSVGHWAADGLLAVFFFVVGLELKHEFVLGALRDRATAAIPIVAAVGGVVVPALTYVLINLVGDGEVTGWAVPSATDIAFALAVLAVVGSRLPGAARTFLLTLAVVDDLIAITIIAAFFTADLSPGWLIPAAAGLLWFRWLTARDITTFRMLAPVAVLTWVAILNSGVHATVAGVLLGLCVPVGRPREADGPDDGRESTATRLHHLVQPVSAGLCVPVFAFFAAGVTVVGGGLGEALRDPITLGVVAGLVLGKPIGVLGATAAMSRFTPARLDPTLGRRALLGLSLLAGIGFTVSLLVGELAFGTGSGADDHVKIGVLAGSAISALAAALILRAGRGRV